MKKIIQLLLVLFTVSMTSQNLDKNWNKVYEFEYAGKIKSASEELNKIYKKARRDNNHAEIIRTFIYQSKFLQTLEEEAQYKIIENLKKELKTKDTANKAVFNFIYGKLLNEYYTQNRYKLKQQTATDTIFNSDFRTWSYADFEKEIAKAFRNSIENETVLLKTPLSDYEKIIVFGKHETDLNQSLYDFLSQKYLENERNSGTESEEGIAFFANNINSFYGETKDFQQLNFDKFKSSLFYKKLSIYQKLEKSYASQNNTLALSNIILKRIQAAYSYRMIRDEYLASLEKFIEKTKNRHKGAFLLEKAKVYQNNASKTENTNYNSKAVAICDEVISRNEEPYLSQAKQIKAGILYKNLTITTEKYIVPNQPNLALVQFKDVDTIYGALYKIPLKLDIKNSYYDSENYYYNNEKKKYINRDSIFIAFANKTKPYKTFQNILPNKNDHFQYSTEVVFPEVETGTYLLMMNIKKDSLSEDTAYSYTIVNASQLTLLYSTSNNIENFLVLNRKTGKPIENVILKSEDYSLTTDLNGSATYQRTSQLENNYKKIFAIRENDTLVQSYYSGHYEYRNNEIEDFKAKVNLFTDRAIYRPGQTVYLKGILSQMKDRQHSVVPNMHISVTAEDVNGQEIYEARLKTNEFGSFIGEFTIPKNTLTGNFTIYANEDKDYETDEHYIKKSEEHPFWDEVDFQESEINFQVEEYKRPKFEVTFEPIKENFIINQTIKIRGKAKAFAGSTISNAEVSYTVNRNSYYNNWYYSRHYNNYDNTQITEGKTKTDENGNFEIEFTATPADGFDEKGLPIFNFTINADVTDINGETRSNNTEAKVGYHTLILTAEVPSIINAKSQQTIPLNSQNLNGQFVPTVGEIKIYKLKSPNRVLNSRPWQAPEIQTIPENEFAKLFPSEPYTNENEPSKWAKGNLIFSEKINTEITKEIVLKDLKKWTSGEYQLFFTSKDAFGKEIEILSNFRLVNNEDKKLADSQLFHYEILNANPKSDGFIEMQFSSATPLLYVVTDAFYKSKSVYNSVIEVKGRKTFKIPIGKDWKKDIKITMSFIWENESSSQQTAVYLPEFQETITLETTSLRNKIEPGSSETWSFSIKNQDNKGIPAEVLATMYDASLDQFSKSNWDTRLSIYNNEYNNIISKQFLGFSSNSTAYFKNLNSAALPIYYHPTQINWFGFDFMRPSQYNAEYQRYLTEKLVQTNGATITGVVSDDSGPLPGVTVSVTGTERSTVTDMDGKYEIKAFIGEFLEFNFIGMADQFAKVSNRVMDINMATNASTLEEVVVTGYGAVKKSNITGSVAVVRAESIEVEADASFDQVLQGSAPGLYVASGNGQPGSMATVRIRGTHSINGDGNPLYILDGNAISAEEFSKLNSSEISAITILKGASATSIYGSRAANGAIIVTTKKSLEALSEVKARKNLSETAFFLPQLQTDTKGNLKFSFTSPEALTQWKLRLLAHNKKTASAYLESNIITQKDLMILPNVPRFLREKDTILITSKIANITPEAKTGIAMLQLFDAVTMEPIDTKMLNSQSVKNFTIKANGNTVVSWKLFIPEGLQGVQYKILAKAGNFTDGEENILPVLTNNILVTESIPLWVRGNTKKEYTFENFKNNQSTTLRNHLLTLEYTSNPAWYAIQSLPYLMEYEHECAEQTFSRYYANTLANEIITSNPKIAAVFETWKKSGKPISKLEQNEELKSLILAETPWVRNAENEEQQKKNLALLFDLEKMKANINDNFEKLDRKQSESGGFAWFSGGNDSEYITRHIVTGLGHLEKLKISNQNIEKFRKITSKAVPFIDEKFLSRDKELELYKKKNKIWNYDTYADLHFLYARSFYIELNPIGDSLKKAINKHLDYTKNNWLQYGLYQKAMAALVLNRFGEKEKAKNILVNLKETAINNEENGMYWIDNKTGWYWYQAPIEIQALLIEAFSEVGNDKKSVEAMKVWLLKNRETKSWSTTKATTEAIYALLLQGEDWISVKDNTVIKLGDEKIMTKKLAENEKEAGSGYIKMNWKADEITKDMATISINNKSNVTGFGGFYWQYFEDLNKIKSSQESPMTIKKELYIKGNTSKGKELQKITSENTLRIGDLVTVRLIIYTKEDMEFVHLKDMRAAAFEPVNIISEYKWQDGLGYYMSTKDAATHFFFDTIRKGKYVLEYDIRVNSQGEFSNGITTIQSMYAPEFSSHTQGIRVKVSE